MERNINVKKRKHTIYLKPVKTSETKALYINTMLRYYTHTHTYIYTLPLKVFKNKQGPGGGTLTLVTEVNSSEDAT